MAIVGQSSCPSGHLASPGSMQWCCCPTARTTSRLACVQKHPFDGAGAFARHLIDHPVTVGALTRTFAGGTSPAAQWGRGVWRTVRSLTASGLEEAEGSNPA
jgi:hypothetical protein